jgi:hypothetical protein
VRAPTQGTLDRLLAEAGALRGPLVATGWATPLDVAAIAHVLLRRTVLLSSARIWAVTWVDTWVAAGVGPL